MKREYTPYLLIYKTQVGSIISILERITGISLFLVLIVLIFNDFFKDYWLLVYMSYFVTFYIYKGTFIVINIIINFMQLNMLYHCLFLSIIFSKINALKGSVNEYRFVIYQDVIRQSVILMLIIYFLFLLIYLLLFI